MRQTYISILIIALTFLQSQVLHGQELSEKAVLAAGEESKAFSSSVLEDHIGADDKYHYFLIRDNQTRKILKYDSNFELVQTKELKFNTKGKVFSRGLVIANSKLFSFYAIGEKKQILLYMQELDRETLEWKGENKQIAAFKKENKSNDLLFGCIFDSETTEFTITSYAMMRPYGRITVITLDAQLTTKFRTDINVSHLCKDNEIEDLLINDEGEAFVVLKEFASSDDRRRYRNTGEPLFKYRLFMQSEDGSNARDLLLETGDKTISDLSFSINSEGAFIGTGFYSETKLGTPAGAIYIRFDTSSGKSVQTSFKPFDFKVAYDAVGKSWSNTTASYEEDEARPYFETSKKQVIQLEDGSTINCFERIYSSSNSLGGQSFFKRYGDIILVKVNKNEEIEWASRVAKCQSNEYYYDQYMSFKIMSINNRLFLLYNDHKDNLLSYNQDDPSLAKKGEAMALILAEVKTTGEIEREPVRIYQENILFCPRWAAGNTKEKNISLYARNPKSPKYLIVGELKFK